MKRKLKARIEYAKFLQDTAREMAKEVQNLRSGDIKQTAEDLDDFVNKVSFQSKYFHINFIILVLYLYFYEPIVILMQVRTGALVSNEEILGFAKLFNDELTLDNISR